MKSQTVYKIPNFKASSWDSSRLGYKWHCSQLWSASHLPMHLIWSVYAICTVIITAPIDKILVYHLSDTAKQVSCIMLFDLCINPERNVLLVLFCRQLYQLRILINVMGCIATSPHGSRVYYFQGHVLLLPYFLARFLYLCSWLALILKHTSCKIFKATQSFTQIHSHMTLENFLFHFVPHFLNRKNGKK